MDSRYYEVLSQLLLTHAGGRISRMAAFACVPESKMLAWMAGDLRPTAEEMARLQALAGSSCRGPLPVNGGLTPI